MSVRLKDSQLVKVIFIVVITALIGELKIIAFSSSFRFGLGSAAFFLLMLFYKDVSYLLTSIITGVFTTFFRIGLDYFFIDSFNFFSSLLKHSPIIGYYFVFAVVLHVGKRSKLFDSPVYLGLLGAFGDGLANGIELLIRSVFSGGFLLSPTTIEYVVIVAILRSFVVVGLFTMISMSQLKAIYDEQQKRFEQVQMITSGLYVEVFYFRKLLSEIEEVTAKSYELYHQLKDTIIPKETSQIALAVAQEVHEVKKDNQRILAGLEKLISQENIIMQLSLAEVIQLVIKANQKYAEMLKKRVDFKQINVVNMQINNVYPLLIILNNLMANAVEAINKEGYIEMKVLKMVNTIQFQLIDNGEGISSEEKEVIFEPGFTTKFDEAGKASTGIGLSHVNSLVEKLNGRISVHSDEGKTVFIVGFPIASLEGRSDIK